MLGTNTCLTWPRLRNTVPSSEAGQVSLNTSLLSSLGSDLCPDCRVLGGVESWSDTSKGRMRELAGGSVGAKSSFRAMGSPGGDSAKVRGVSRSCSRKGRNKLEANRLSV